MIKNIITNGCSFTADSCQAWPLSLERREQHINFAAPGHPTTFAHKCFAQQIVEPKINKITL